MEEKNYIPLINVENKGIYINVENGNVAISSEPVTFLNTPENVQEKGVLLENITEEEKNALKEAIDPRTMLTAILEVRELLKTKSQEEVKETIKEEQQQMRRREELDAIYKKVLGNDYTYSDQKIVESLEKTGVFSKSLPVSISEEIPSYHSEREAILMLASQYIEKVDHKEKSEQVEKKEVMESTEEIANPIEDVVEVENTNQPVATETVDSNPAPTNIVEETPNTAQATEMASSAYEQMVADVVGESPSQEKEVITPPQEVVIPTAAPQEPVAPTPEPEIAPIPTAPEVVAPPSPDVQPVPMNPEVVAVPSGIAVAPTPNSEPIVQATPAPQLPQEVIQVPTSLGEMAEPGKTI